MSLKLSQNSTALLLIVSRMNSNIYCQDSSMNCSSKLGLLNGNIKLPIPWICLQLSVHVYIQPGNQPVSDSCTQVSGNLHTIDISLSAVVRSQVNQAAQPPPRQTGRGASRSIDHLSDSIWIFQNAVQEIWTCRSILSHGLSSFFKCTCWEKWIWCWSQLSELETKLWPDHRAHPGFPSRGPDLLRPWESQLQMDFFPKAKKQHWFLETMSWGCVSFSIVTRHHRCIQKQTSHRLPSFLWTVKISRIPVKLSHSLPSKTILFSEVQMASVSVSLERKM